MKILWVKQGPLLPLDSGGKIRTWNLLKELGKQHEVTALSFFPAHAHADHSGAEQHLKRLVAMPVALPVKYSLPYRLGYLRKLLSPVPFVVGQYGLPEVRERLSSLVEQEDFDLVVCDFIFPCLNMPDSLPCPLILFAHNAETMIWQRHYQVARGPVWKLITGLEYLKMRRFEARRARVFDHVITVSEPDAIFFRQFVPAARVSVLPTGVDLEYYRPSTAPERPRNLVFTGSMDWLANQDAITFFAEKILPLILRTHPGVTLSIAGRDPTEKLRRLAQSVPQIQLTGTVPDVRPYIEEAAVYVLPLQVGSGTRLKVFEALAMGKAMVSTTVGVEGLPVVSGRDLLVADTPEDFAAAVTQLLDDPARRRRLGQSARQLVEGGFGWPQVARSFTNILAQVVQPDPRQSSALPLPMRLAPSRIPQETE